MRRPLAAISASVLLALPLALFACHRTSDGDSITSPNDGTKKPKPEVDKDQDKKKTKEPPLHRKEAQACAPGPTKGDVEGRDAGPRAEWEEKAAKCKTDAECKDGKNGRCAMTGGGRMMPHASCVYDACFADKDCPAKSACSCGGSPGRGNFCQGGNCATDADCPGSWCSPSYGTACGPYGGIAGNFCHTADDDCTSDEECKGKPGGPGYCAYFQESGHWKCSFSHCVG